MYSTLIGLIMAGLTAFSQQPLRSISGTVTTADTQETLPGASVLIKNTNRGTTTDINGNYSLDLQTGDSILVFSYTGYEPQQVTVLNQTFVDVVLETNATNLDEVVVIGYGTVKKTDLSGSVSSIAAKDLSKITTSNPILAAQGKAAGVQVTNSTGQPGSTPIVRIRGVGTFNNSAPIYVVDGVILNDISFLSSSDIETMTILKDASSTAIYGSRGANGVVMITTKQGSSSQEKATFGYHGEIGLQQLSKKIDLLSGKEFAIVSNAIKLGSYNNVDAVPNTDWQDLIFHQAPVQSHEFFASGSTKTMQYYIGISYYNQQGIIDKSGYERISFKLNNIYTLSDRLKIGNNITVSPYKQQIAPDVTYAAYRAQPLLVPYYPDGSYGVVYNVGNPLASLAYSNNENKGVRAIGNIYAELKLMKSLLFKSSFGIDGSYDKSVSFTPAYTVYNPDGTASQQQNVYSDLNKGYGDSFSWLWENTLNYHNTFGKNLVDVVAGYTMQRNTNEAVGIPAQNILRDGSSFWYISSPSYLTNTYTSIYDRVDANNYYSMISYLLRANYVYNDKYIVTATFRRDGSSKFAEGNRYGNFPSFALGWNMAQENFIKNISLISTLKLRTSYGLIGNEKIPYDARYSQTTNVITIFGLNAAPNAGVTYGVSGNENLVWETTEQFDVGLEAGILNDRLTAEFDYYNKTTNDILLFLSVPGYLGNGQNAKVAYNAAKVRNTGFEFNLNWKDVINRDLSYSVGILGSTLQNEVLEIGGNAGIDSVLIGGYLGNGIPVTQSRVGLPIGAFYGYQTDGIFQNQAELDAYPHDGQAGVGDLRFVDINDDGVINGLDRTYIGSPIPKFIFGFTLTVNYKGFDFSALVQGQTGNKIFNGKEVVRPDPYNFEHHVINYWDGEGSSNTEPRPSFGGYNYTPSDHFVQDGSYARLRNITLGYTIPERLLKKASITNLRFYIKADNLFTFTKFTGYTPDIASENVISNGIDNGTYPISSVYSIGVNLNF
ncbi:MAG: TonB-dependent receptor [Bacteroidales bacterium]|nr:TonB-dependent receptor [Bacteroidales bacterium]